MDIKWYYTEDGRNHGPYTPGQLKKMGESGQITSGTFVRNGEDGKWILASNVKGLLAAHNKPSHIVDDNAFDNTNHFGSNDTQMISPVEWGISSIILGSMLLICQLYPIILIGVASKSIVIATVMTVGLLLAGGSSIFMGVMGISRSRTRRFSGLLYSIVGVILSFLSLIASITLLVLISKLSDNLSRY